MNNDVLSQDKKKSQDAKRDSEEYVKNLSIVFEAQFDRLRGHIHDVRGMLSGAKKIIFVYLEDLESQESQPDIEYVKNIMVILNEIGESIDYSLINDTLSTLGDQPLRDALSSYIHLHEMGIKGIFKLNIEFIFDITDSIDLFPIIADAFYIISREAITNAIRHGQPNQINIKVNQSDNEFILEVKDDGHGFDPESEKRRSGLYYINKIAESLNGKASIVSEPNTGTSIIISIPMSH